MGNGDQPRDDEMADPLTDLPAELNEEISPPPPEEIANPPLLANEAVISPPPAIEAPSTKTSEVQPA